MNTCLSECVEYTPVVTKYILQVIYITIKQIDYTYIFKCNYQYIYMKNIYKTISIALMILVVILLMIYAFKAGEQHGVKLLLEQMRNTHAYWIK